MGSFFVLQAQRSMAVVFKKWLTQARRRQQVALVMSTKACLIRGVRALRSHARQQRLCTRWRAMVDRREAHRTLHCWRLLTTAVRHPSGLRVAFKQWRSLSQEHQLVRWFEQGAALRAWRRVTLSRHHHTRAMTLSRQHHTWTTLRVAWWRWREQLAESRRGALARAFLGWAGVVVLIREQRAFHRRRARRLVGDTFDAWRSLHVERATIRAEAKARELEAKEHELEAKALEWRQRSLRQTGLRALQERTLAARGRRLKEHELEAKVLEWRQHSLHQAGLNALQGRTLDARVRRLVRQQARQYHHTQQQSAVIRDLRGWARRRGLLRSLIKKAEPHAHRGVLKRMVRHWHRAASMGQLRRARTECADVFQQQQLTRPCLLHWIGVIRVAVQFRTRLAESHHRNDLALHFLAWSRALGGLRELQRQADENCRTSRLRKAMAAWIVAEPPAPPMLPLEPIEACTVFRAWRAWSRRTAFGHILIHTRTHTYTHAHIHYYTRTHTYTHVHTRTHTYTR
jgi:CRISPR/Cas system-associated endoribonuclease Cas2